LAFYWRHRSGPFLNWLYRLGRHSRCPMSAAKIKIESIRAWATTRATTKSATTSHGCGASGKRNALATVRRFNATLSAKGYVWFWPKIAAALTSKHHWLVIVCDSCGTVIDLDLRVKPRDPEASIRVALRDVQCPRCNGHGRPRIIALAQHTSI
jgi:hypothetical protein